MLVCSFGITVSCSLFSDQFQTETKLFVVEVFLMRQENFFLHRSKFLLHIQSHKTTLHVGRQIQSNR